MIYKNWRTGEEVRQDDAYGYAINAVQEDSQLLKEFKAAMVDWFFSGGTWMKEDNNEDL